MPWRQIVEQLAPTPSEPVTIQERLDELVREHGSMNKVAKVIGVDAGYLSHIYAGTKPGSEAALAKIGLRRVITYERL
jgi:deoxyinosine 3'endonuclease (endonuclease V)